MFDIEALDQFYRELSNPAGILVADFQEKYVRLFAGSRSGDDVKDYRLGKKPWKKLKDEVTPIFNFLKYNQIRAHRVRFPLDNDTPDCWLFDVNGEDRGVEVTIERGRERYHLAKELNNTGEGRGFIGVQDDAAKEKFSDKMSSPRSMYTTERALDVVKAGILRCLSRKNDVKYSKVYYLVIQTDFSILPKQRWYAIENDLRINAINLPFQEIHAVGKVDGELFGFQIK